MVGIIYYILDILFEQIFSNFEFDIPNKLAEQKFRHKPASLAVYCRNIT